MAYDFHYTPTGTGVISGKEVLEQTEDAINDLGNTAISGVQEALDKAEQALTNSENAVDDAQTALNTANNAEGVAIQAQTDVGNLSGTVTNIGNRVTTAEGNISNLQGRMTTAEGNITNLQGRMTTAESNIGNLQTAVSTAQATANSAQQTATTARQQSYVFRYSGTAITDNSTIAYSTIDNTDNIKAGDKILDVDGKLFEITAVDTANQTVTVGTALIDLALDANVMHLSGNEDVNGIKNFKDLIPIDGDYLGNESSVNARTNICLRSNRDTVGKSGVYVTKYRPNKAQGSMGANDLVYISFDALEDEVRTNGALSIQCSGWVDNVLTKVKIVSGISDSTFGSSVKPSKINDLNPGSLSFPDLSAGLDISGYITSGNTHNEYTPTVDGWISVILKSTSGATGLFLYQGDMGSGHYSTLALPNESEACVMASLPVKAGTVVNIDTRGSNNYVYSAKFYPCLGNV